MASSSVVSDFVAKNDLEANENVEVELTKVTVEPAKLTVSNEKIISPTASIVRDAAAELATELLTSEIILPSATIASNTQIKVEPIQSRFYPGDVVLFKEDRKLEDWMPLFGTVLNPSEGSEMERNPDKGAVNEFHVHWDFTNRITLTQRPTTSLVDRVLLRGQRVENKNGDVGTVVDFEISTSVVINGTDKVVKNVSLSRLRPISAYVRGQEVLMKGWTGVITSIKRNVWFRMDGGFIFYMEVDELDGFSRVDPYWGLGLACPGMRTQLPSRAFKKAKWVSRSMKFFNSWLPLHRLYPWAYATITRTEVIELEVKWLQRVPGEPDDVKMPSSTVTTAELNELVVIGTPSTETVGINSVRKLQILPSDDITKYNYWLQGFKNKFVDGLDPLECPTNKSEADGDLKDVTKSGLTETPVKILLRHNVVTVQWKDGKLEKIPAIDIPKISPTADDGEFPMGLTVAPVEKNSANGDKYGIVMASADLAKSRSRKVNVRWMVEGRDQGIEQVSIFEIRPHHLYSLYHRGTIVFDRKPSAASMFISAVVIDLNVAAGRMVVKTTNDNSEFEVYPHQVIALSTRCHWSFFSREWILDHMIPPTYQLDLEFSPMHKLVDVSEQRWDLLMDQDTNNPPSEDPSTVPTIWDEPPFELLAFAPKTHRYYNCSNSQSFGRGFAQAVGKEMVILKEKDNVPEGIWVRCYENRLDLISALMVGPSKTPYEDGLFLFDIQLPADFPTSSPSVHYVSYTHEIHPLLSFDGNVCVNQLMWIESEPTDSQISHFLAKLQATIFTPAPFFAHIPAKPIENTENGQIKARMYNQNVFVRMLDALWNMLQNPHAPWERTIRNHFATAMPEKYMSIERLLREDDETESIVEAESYTEDENPSYPLLPIPDGMRISVLKRMERLKKLFNVQAVGESNSVTDTTADSESFEVPSKEPQLPVVTPDPSRMLTPIAEITEPSSTSTFGAKLSNVHVPSDTDEPGQPISLDSLRNVKHPNKFTKSVKGHPENEEADEDDEGDNDNNAVAADT